ncbi:MAG: DUF814 domain-containing protein [Nanoarchaeota archaeon]|nr:DUF814 domain-containing protein [Nanoarchaeota archaeon]
MKDTKKSKRFSVPSQSHEIAKGYKKYKWFYTSSGKLVVGGKSAAQNDDLLKSLKNEYFIMHTSHPGSPFCVIVSELKKVTKKDLEECAIFTGCFSRAWKQGKKKTGVDIFKTSQISKEKRMKIGMWGVSGKVKRVKIELKLALTKQKGVLRAVPEKSVKKKNILLKICPGRIDKKDMFAKFQIELEKDKLNPNELLAALPAGGVRICNN